jgi:hypothetical protein
MPIVWFGLLPCEQLKDRRPGGKLRTIQIHPKINVSGRVLEKMKTMPELMDVTQGEF